MTDTSKSPPSPTKVQLHTMPADLGSDLVLWRRKQLNLVILSAATATWILMEFYQYNFITLFSWLVMALVVCLFFWGSIHRLLKKEAPDLSELEISEETTMKTANSLRQWSEEGVRLMFHVSAEREWFVFLGVVASLYLTSVLANYLDFLTLCYIGLVGGMSVPLIYVKNENRIRECGEKLRIKSERLYSTIGEKLQKMKSKIAGQRKEIQKEKKME